MTIRTSEKTVTFRNPFVIGGFDEVLPAGVYSVETDEELLEGISFPAYRRILTVIHLHAEPNKPGLARTLTVDPNDLDAALQRDQAPAEVPSVQDASHLALNGTTESHREGLDRQAIERGEDDGMVVHAV
jgi:hypothetical protein